MGLRAAIKRRVAGWAVKRALRRLGVDMSGWKTWLGGIGMIAAGVAQVASGLAANNWDDAVKGIALIGAGLAALGIGHKIEKSGITIEETGIPAGPTATKRDELLGRKPGK